MYEDGIRRERPGRGCIIALIIVAVIILGIILFVRFGVPRIIARVIANGESIGFIPDEFTEALSTNRDEFKAALAEYNMDTGTVEDMIDSISSKKLVGLAEKINDGTLVSADQAFGELIKQIDFGNADIEKLRKEVSNADFSSIKQASADIVEHRKAISLTLPMIKDTLKAFFNEMGKE